MLTLICILSVISMVIAAPEGYVSDSKYEITKPGGYAVKNYGVYGRDTYGYGEKSYGIRRTGYAPNYAGYGDKSYGRRYLGYKVKGYENYGPGYAGARYAGYRPAAYGYGYNKNVPYGDAFPYKNVGPNGAVVNSPSDRRCGRTQWCSGWIRIRSSWLCLLIITSNCLEHMQYSHYRQCIKISMGLCLDQRAAWQSYDIINFILIKNCHLL
ncbi:unnamed protein product [Owenia fusiformis]|uniref:Uncharacterized protein n=1 Tax=Owenia fusiformis TaxID=6347 RepID=A0A8S4P6P2_OWEFU|nr:unnamed protein product [Owenia fusiformis]